MLSIKAINSSVRAIVTEKTEFSKKSVLSTVVMSLVLQKNYRLFQLGVTRGSAVA